ncbi:SUF system NifU family Fe-S cluster assembly protein [Massilia sp. B-10]|nr:SUF system NifU family Fe-S cluster assembly protein [Massilia sp. B-10]
MSELRDLYQEVIFDHYKKPRNFHPLAHASHIAHGHNRLCGDQLTLYLEVDGGVIRDLSFKGEGCAISTASASLMTEALKGKTLDQAEQLSSQFRHMITHEGDDESALGKLAVLAGVREFPARIKCASLAWETLQTALNEAAGGKNMEADLSMDADEHLRAQVIAALRTVY